MPIPYQNASRSLEEGCAAYIDLLWIEAEATYYGGMLLIDSKGRPLEFTHNSLRIPQDAVWKMANRGEIAASMIAHSLFESCNREPDLLICCASFGSISFCRDEIAPLIPFAQINVAQDEAEGGARIEWYWINDPPHERMRAWILFEILQQKGMLLEPFSRIQLGLQEVYPHALWDTLITDDTD